MSSLDRGIAPSVTHLLRVLRCLMLLGLSFASPASANMSAPLVEGDLVSEPAPSLRNMHIVHEDLTIDLSPLAEPRQPALIRARYRVRNDGPAQTVELFFAAPGLKTGQVKHQGAPVAARVDARALHEIAPNEEALHHRATEGLVFAVNFQPGEQVVEVSYAAMPDRVPHAEVNSYAIDYLLSPARRWASFGTLALELKIPQGWRVLDLPRALQAGADASEQRASFQGLPGKSPPHALATRTLWDLHALPVDTLRMRVAPPSWPYWLSSGVHWLALLAAVSLPVLAGRELRRRARAGHPVSLQLRLLSLVIVLALVVVLPLISMAPDLWWTKHRSHLGYGPIFLVLGTWLVGAVACLVAHATFGWKRSGSAAVRGAHEGTS
jgi:hypothetical protein